MSSCILVSSHRLPTTDPLYLDDNQVAEFLNGYCALWHPCAIQLANSPPKILNPGELTDIQPEILLCFTSDIQEFPGKEWEQLPNRRFMAAQNRPECLNNLLQAVEGPPAPTTPESEKVLGLFFGTGYSYLTLNSLFDAMQHENLISHESFWEESKQAAKHFLEGALELASTSLRNALGILQSAREILHSSTIFLVDLGVTAKGKIPHVPNTPGVTSNLVLTGKEILGLDPEELEYFKELVQDDRLEICGGLHQDELESALPLSSRVWNLATGRREYFQAFGKECKVYCKTKPGLMADTPRVLHLAGINKAVMVSMDDTQVPVYRGPVFSWSSSIGRQIETFCRQPLDGDSLQTWFQLPYQLARVLQQDSSPTLVFLRRKKTPLPLLLDFFSTCSGSQTFGKWHTLSVYLQEVYPSEYPGPLSQDDFPVDSLPTVPGESEAKNPLSSAIEHLRLRKELDAAKTLSGMIAAVKGWDSSTAARTEESLQKFESQFETTGTTEGFRENQVLEKTATVLANRILARGEPGAKGYLLINPGALARRVGLEFPVKQGIGMAKSVLACHHDQTTSRSLVEVPGTGFTWVPLADPQSPAVFSNKFSLASVNLVRNEFFEIEADQATGGIKAFRDLKTRSNRLSMQIVSQIGSKMISREIKILSAGPVCGEIESQGVIQGANQENEAHFSLKIKAWVGRPMLEVQLTLTPERAFGSDPWHDNFALRFAWPTEQVQLLRGLGGRVLPVTANRFEGAQFLEWKWGSKKTHFFPMGLSHMEKKGGRMLDVLVQAKGESVRKFHFGLSLDRDHPFQMAMALETPLVCLPVDKGPPPSGNSGWLFHLDSVNIVLHYAAPVQGEDAVMLLLEEVGGFATPCDLRCPRDVVRACLVDLDGREQSDLSARGDTVTIYPECNGLMVVKVIFQS
ncbi:MAG: hypothetical protein EXR99_01240 [Gemmataceae bacterium]|nr:hypothetical protein [Gemmataceae bacterium]